MSYDRADWHYGGDFPKDLPTENGGTHIGMFLAGAIMNNFEGAHHVDHSQDSIRQVRERRMTGRQFLIKECDENIWDEDPSDLGNGFAKY